MQDDLYNDPILDKAEAEEVDSTPSSEEAFDDVEFVETDGEGMEKKDREKLKMLREELKKAQSEARENLTALQRSRADYVNLKRELEETRDVTKRKTTEHVIMELLPTLDSFDMAMGNMDAWNAVDPKWRIGVEFIYGQLKTALENQGVRAIDQVNVPFDHALHESIGTADTDDTSLDHMIQKVVQKGYQMGERIIRPARVMVWKKKED